MKALLTILSAASLGGWLTLYGPNETASGSAEAQEYAIDPEHSVVVFRTKHLGVSNFYGRFNEVAGVVFFDQENPAQSSIEVEIAPESIDTANARRDQHLRSPDFFSVKEFPTISFRSTEVEGTNEALKITGELELHGVTKEVTAEGVFVGAAETFMGYRAGFEVHFTIDMRDFDIGFLKSNPGAVGPEVDLTVALECIRP